MLSENAPTFVTPPTFADREHRAIADGLERRRKVSASYEARIRADAERIVRREVADLRAMLEATAGFGQRDRFRAGLDGYYFADPPGYVREHAQGSLAGLMETIAGLAAAEVDAKLDPDTTRSAVDAYLVRFVAKYLARSRKQVYGLLKKHGDDFTAPLDDRLAEWEERRPGKIGQEERVEAASAAAKAVWAAAGFNALRWVLLGDSCPICMSLRDRIVHVESPFVAAGEEVPSHFGGTGFIPGGSIQYPPAHAGCDCSIVPTRV